jgi:putative ATP-binding cassette transporter
MALFWPNLPFHILVGDHIDYCTALFRSFDDLKDKIEVEEKPGDQTLSGGEKQRLPFARLFLHDPDIVVLDEATSALDANSQDKMMESLIKELPGATLVSVAHRAELEDFHSRKTQGRCRLVRDIDLVPSKSKGRLLGRWLRRA